MKETSDKHNCGAIKRRQGRLDIRGSALRRWPRRCGARVVLAGRSVLSNPLQNAAEHTPGTRTAGPLPLLIGPQNTAGIHTRKKYIGKKERDTLQNKAPVQIFKQ